jgi:hypothetical protein
MSDIKHYALEQQTDPVTGRTYNAYRSNMGTPDGKHPAHFCCDCMLPFRETDMIKFRGKWYGVPCGDYRHAADIFRKEKQRAYKPRRYREPGDVPLVITQNP